MGYTTEFEGRFNLDRPLAGEHAAYLRRFADTRRVSRIDGAVAEIGDPHRCAVGLPPGPQGAYFVGGGGFMGQDRDASIMNYNKPPEGQPGLWCQWTPTHDGSGLEWNGVEKFYYYVEWLEYLIQHFLKPWGYVLNGSVRWKGEDPEDAGVLSVHANIVVTTGTACSGSGIDA